MYGQDLKPLKSRYSIAQRFIALTVLCILYWSCDVSFADCLPQWAASIPKSERIGAIVRPLSGSPIYSLNTNETFQPASTMKLFTSLLALEELGPEFVFSTKVLVDSSNPGRLYIQGGGDPDMRPEKVWMLARQIYLTGTSAVHELVLDDGSFDDPVSPQGHRAYSGGTSALAFNFNSIGVSICPGKPHGPALVTPLLWELNTPVKGNVKTVPAGAAEVSLDFDDGIFNISGQIGSGEACKVLYASNLDPTSSFGRMLASSLESLKLGSKITFKKGSVPRSARTLTELSSSTLKEILAGMNHYSVNVTAEQVLTRLGTMSDGRFSHLEGTKKLQEFIERLVGTRSSAKVLDGSGLSHENEVTPLALTAVFSEASRKPRIWIELLSTLPVYSESGTLKTRRPLLGEAVIRAKSGTLDGVSALSGIITSSAHSEYAFALLQNNVASRDAALEIEHKFLECVLHSIDSSSR